MRVEYRGHLICLEGKSGSAEVIERSSGALLPTKVTGEPNESLRDLARRARELIDLYVGDESSGAPTRT